MRFTHVVVALAVTVLAPVSASHAAEFGPKLKKCAKVSKGKRAACKKSNASTKKVFNLIKDATFDGTLSNGVRVNATFCASGKWSVLVTYTDGHSNAFSGSAWRLTDAYVRARYVSGLATGPSNNIFTRVALQRRGQQWVYSRGNPALEAPPVTRTSATQACAAL